MHLTKRTDRLLSNAKMRQETAAILRYTPGLITGAKAQVKAVKRRLAHPAQTGAKAVRRAQVGGGKELHQIDYKTSCTGESSSKATSPSSLAPTAATNSPDRLRVL